MNNLDAILYFVAFVLFLLAAAPADLRGWQAQWLAFGVLVLSLLV